MNYENRLGVILKMELMLLIDVNTMYLPRFQEKTHTWIHPILFSDGDLYGELHLFYNIKEGDWQIPHIFYHQNDGPIWKRNLKMEPKTRFQLYQNPYFQSFLQNRKKIYDDIETIRTNPTPSVCKVQYIQENEAVCYYEVFFKETKLPWKFEFLLHPLSIDWSLHCILIQHGDNIFGNLVRMFPFESYIVENYCKHKETRKV
ncbi:MAG: hypothetical protein ACI35O_03430 [Bacillaceae bacterium]